MSETWLNEINDDLFKLDNYDLVNINRPNKNGGGVGIYISNKLEYNPRFDRNFSIEDIIESVFIEIITVSVNNILVGVI